MTPNRLIDSSPRMTARLAGFFYLFNIATILLAAYLFRGLFVSGDTTATARNLVAHGALFRFGFGAQIISTACSIAVAALLYELFKPVSRGFSLLAAFFRVIACGIAILGYALQLARVHILTAAPTSAILPDRSGVLVPLLHNMNVEIVDISIVFFGCAFFVVGMLIFASKFLPRSLGLLIGLAGLSGLVFLAPQLATPLFPYFAALGLLAETSLALRLALGGVNVERWNELVAAHALTTALKMAGGRSQPTIRDAFVYSVGASA